MYDFERWFPDKRDSLKEAWAITSKKICLHQTKYSVNQVINIRVDEIPHLNKIGEERSDLLSFFMLLKLLGLLQKRKNDTEIYGTNLEESQNCFILYSKVCT